MAKLKSGDDTEGTTEEEGPNALVGSGAPMVTVRANAGVLGLAAGETSAIPRSEEVTALIASGMLTEAE